MILNFAGGIVSAIWLIILGDWGLVLIGVVGSLIASFLIGFVLMIGLIFAIPAMKFGEKGYRIPALIFGFLSQVVTVAIISFWCLYVFSLFLQNATVDNWIPFAILSYAIATTPFNFLASKEQDNEFTQLTLFFIQVAYILLLICFLLFNLTTVTSVYVFLAVMIVCLIVLVVIMISGSNKITTGSSIGETYFNDEREDDLDDAEQDTDKDDNTFHTKVLLVHSDSIIIDSIIKELRVYGLKFECGKRGEEGLYLASSNKYDLAIIELNLPDMKGEKVLEKIKQYSPSLPIWMISENSNLQLLKESIKKGADDFITQPINFDDLSAKVVNLSILK